jgi:hypothetical protein
MNDAMRKVMGMDGTRGFWIGQVWGIMLGLKHWTQLVKILDVSYLYSNAIQSTKHQISSIVFDMNTKPPKHVSHLTRCDYQDVGLVGMAWPQSVSRLQLSKMPRATGPRVHRFVELKAS